MPRCTGYLVVVALLCCGLVKVIAVRKVLSVQELCTHNLMRPVVRLSTRGPYVSALGLVLEGVRTFPQIFDCTLTLQTTEPGSVLGLSLSHLQMMITNQNTLECFDYLEINDGVNAIRLCGDLRNRGKESLEPQATIPTHFDSVRGFITIHIFSRAAATFPLRREAPSLEFFFNLVASYKANDQKKCDAFGGFWCGPGGRCLPQRLVCDLYPDCGQINPQNDEKSNCSNSSTNWNPENPTNMSPIAISIVVVAGILCLASLTIILIWSRRHFLYKNDHSTSNQDLTNTNNTEPVIFSVDSCHYASTDIASAPPYESLYPSAVSLSPQTSLNANEAPPAYDVLFGVEAKESV